MATALSGTLQVKVYQQLHRDKYSLPATPNRKLYTS